ncbi:MAG TPA: acyltransferase family protein [Nocardioidaceae bacterium]|nr:acyltransferase family protein [Nocardioidaceae bacterium]
MTLLTHVQTRVGPHALTRPGPRVPATRPAKRSALRADIQGLRAVAVVSVALNHAQVGAISGGFVGVDVFFVISGFLITQLLLREVAETGRLSLAGFYARRARRILPAASLVVVATVLSSVLLLGYVRAAAVVRDSVWAAFFAANVKFARDKTDYFSADNPPSPLQHFWSLAVEEQFYLVWPVLLLCIVLTVRAIHRRGAERASLRPADHHRVVRRITVRRATLLVLAVVCGGSLAWSVWLTDHQPAGAYFSTTARAWELAAGACCAVLVPRTALLRGVLADVLAWGGLLSIALSVAIYSESTPFPGYAAMAPVAGTVVLIATRGGSARRGPLRLLANAVAGRLGDWSYSLYLWHWPLLVVAVDYLGRPLDLDESLTLVAVAVALSAATYALVENPMRRARLLSAATVRGLAVYPAALALTLGAAVVAQQQIDREALAAASVPAVTLDNFGPANLPGFQLSRDPATALVQASTMAALNDRPVPGHLSPDLLGLQRDVADVGACDYSTGTRELCERGDVGGDKVLVALGDSHARAWIPALEIIAKREGYSAYYLVKQGCNPGQVVPDVGNGPYTGCVEWRDWAVAQIERLQPDLVFIANDLPPAVVEDGASVDDQPDVADAVERGLEDTIRLITPSVGRVVLAGDGPGMPELPGDCLSARGATLGDCVFRRGERAKLLFEAQRDAALAVGADFVNTLPWFCYRGWCPAVVGSTVTYRDTEHITTAYAAQLAAPLQRAMGM